MRFDITRHLRIVESKGGVPVIAPLRKILDQHKRLNNSAKWIFAGEKKGFALHLDNLSRRDIRPALGDRWHGWHAFRRGLTTNLYGLGVPPETAQILLRHADASTTRKHYLVLKSNEQGAAATQKLEKALANKGRIRAKGTSLNANSRMNIH